MTRAYAFGDTPTASVRLDVLARVFAPASARLLGELSVPPGGLVLDLGCGPGHTTAMLAAAFPSARVVGLDSSPAFAAEAAASVGSVGSAGPVDTAGHVVGPAGRRAFAVADVARSALPCAPCDLAYARFLCVHLADPRARVAAWGTALRPGGVVAVEEPEQIDTDDEGFRRYLELAAVVVGARGGDLYAGRQLVGLDVPPALVSEIDRSVPLDVATGAAASIFALNLATWHDDPALAHAVGPAEARSLLDELEARRPDETTGVIRWHMRQVALRRIS